MPLFSIRQLLYFRQFLTWIFNSLKDELKREISNEAHKLLRELTKEVIVNEGNLIDFGLELGYQRYIIDQVRVNNSRSIENAGFETIEQKCKVLLEAIRATGNELAVEKWEEKLEFTTESVIVVPDLPALGWATLTDPLDLLQFPSTYG